MKLFTIMEVHDAELGQKLETKYVHVVAGDWNKAVTEWASFRIPGSENEMSLREAYIDWHSERTMVRCSFCHDQVITHTAHENWKVTMLKPYWNDGVRIDPVWHVVTL